MLTLVILVFKVLSLEKRTQGHGHWQQRAVAGTDGAESIFSCRKSCAQSYSQFLVVAGAVASARSSVTSVAHYH